MSIKVNNPKHAIILLLILIAIGGIVMYGKDKTENTGPKNIAPVIKGPTTPPPGYEAPR